jgi:hypothetical protein
MVGEIKRSHLELIQGVVNRLSTNSFLLKGWSVVLVSGLFALAASGTNSLFVYLAYFPACAFWALDGYFLWQERLFRNLYDDVRQRDEEEIDFSMDTSDVAKLAGGWWGASTSLTLRLFHGAILLTILIVMLVIVFSK